ncbi:MAG: hypothetical protein HOO93_07810 [Methyloglobulus sp.]|nr:hypothetical protein [Methyloglobulus sp.]
MLSYATTGIALVFIASVISWFIVKRNAAQQPKQVKIILFGLYFWGLIFLQLAICAVAYYLNK